MDHNTKCKWKNNQPPHSHTHTHTSQPHHSHTHAYTHTHTCIHTHTLTTIPLTHTHAYTHTPSQPSYHTSQPHTHTYTRLYKSWVQLSPSSNQDGFTCFVGCTQPYLTNSEGNYWNKTSNIQSLLPQNNNHCITCQFQSMTSFVLPTFYAFVNNCYQSCCDSSLHH